MQPQSSDLSSVSPSFNSYSSSAKLADDVVARVCGEQQQQQPPPNQSHDDGEEEEDDFEFVSLSANPDREFFFDGGGIRPIFPVFNRDLLLDQRDADACDSVDDEPSGGEFESIRIPLKKLFLDDRDPPSSSSSSEADEMERVTPGTYCVWTPKLVEPSPSPGRCKKSNSTGSSSTSAKQSKRWWFRDLLKRSNSEGKDSSFVFLTPAHPSSPNSTKKGEEKAEKGENSKEKMGSGELRVAAAGKSKAKGAAVGGENKQLASAHEKFYVRNRKMREEDKRRSYLPYRQDLVGFFANVNGLGRTFPPF